MVARINSLLYVLVFLFSFFLQSSVSHHATTAIFDVSVSIQKTVDILSSNLVKQEAKFSHFAHTSSSISSSFSLSIFSRLSISGLRSKDYESLVRSRLARDSARVNSILAKVNSLEPISSSKSLTAPVTSGPGEYFARIGIGNPVKNYYWIIDTGSDINWLQCLPCEQCYNQSDPLFDPSTSSTYHSLSCDSTQCQALNSGSCRTGSCQYEVTYGDGSFTTGDFATETLSFGSFGGSVSNLSIGCGRDNEGLFEKAAGLLGLGGGPLSLPSQLKATSFSYCLVDMFSTGSSTLEFDSAQLRNPITTRLVPNMRHMTYRYIQVTGMSVGGRRLRVPSYLFAVNSLGQGGMIIDSGTTVTRLTTLAYYALRNEFRRRARNFPRRIFGYSIFDTCYRLSSGKFLVPTVSFNFPGNQTLNLPVENILFPVDSRGTFCLAFAPSNSFSIIGNIQQQTMRVNFDLVNSAIEFSPKQC